MHLHLCSAVNIVANYANSSACWQPGSCTGEQMQNMAPLRAFTFHIGFTDWEAN